MTCALLWHIDSQYGHCFDADSIIAQVPLSCLCLFELFEAAISVT